MKTSTAFLLFAVVFAAALAANLIALKIAADQIKKTSSETPLGQILDAL